MKKAIIRYLLITVILNMFSVPILSYAEESVVVTEFFNATFDNKVENASAHGTYWSDKLQIQNWVDNDPKYVKDPLGDGSDLCVSSLMKKDSNRFFSAFALPKNATVEKIKQSNLLYISFDLYLPKDFSGKLLARVQSVANKVHIAIFHYSI